MLTFTRGKTIDALKDSEWLTVPAWLAETEDAWPKAPGKLQFSIKEEPEPVMEAVVIESPFEWEKFGSIEKMIRVLSYCFRWRKKKCAEILTVEELNAANWQFRNVASRKVFMMPTRKSLKGNRCQLQIN